VVYTTQVVSVYYTGGLSSTTIDKAFARDKWINIIRYYHYKLLSPSMSAYKRDFKRAAKQLLKNGSMRDRITAIAVYLYFKFAKLMAFIKSASVCFTLVQTNKGPKPQTLLSKDHSTTGQHHKVPN